MMCLCGVDAAWAASTTCWIDQGAVVVSASFGDLAGDFLIEIASPISQLNETEASAAGFQGSRQRATLRLAGLRVRKARFAVAKLDYLPQTDTSIIGVIGADLLSRYALRIDFSPCRLTLARKLPSDNGPSLPVTRLQGVPMVEASYTDGEASRTEPMAISTGRWESLIPGASLARTPKAETRPPLRLRTLRVAGEQIAPAPAALADGPVGTIGLSALTHWRSMSLSHRTLTLTP